MEEDLKYDLEQLKYENEVNKQRLNDVYEERDRLVALISTFYPSHLARHEGEDWDDNWRNVVYIETPEGQLSWHIADDEVHLFGHLVAGENDWDGHTTEEKYKRVERLVQRNYEESLN